MTKPIATKQSHSPEKYFKAIGRRKNAVARVRVYAKKHGITINNIDYKEYFKIAKYQDVVASPFVELSLFDKMGATIVVSGGGMTGQADAIRHGISRALIKFDESLRKKLRLLGFLTRDPRMVERKKYGLKKARRAPQWAKR